MAENRNIEVGGRLHSIATGNVLAGANEIFDDSKNKKQSDINTETYSLVNNVNERLSGLSPDQQSALSVAAKATNNETKLGYYVCGTEGNVAAKVISDATGYVLSPGGSIKVKMTNANTVNNATLNINSTGAKALYYDGERASANNSWEAGETIEIYYDGTSFYANSVAGGSGSGDGAFDVSAKTGNTYETLSAALTAANSILSASKKKGGMSIKFIQLTPATYTVVKTEGVETQPTGTEVQEELSLESGTYTAAQMTGVTPPTSGSVTYYLAVTVDETTTYTTWVITKATSDVQRYVQCRLMLSTFTAAQFVNPANWQGVDAKPTAGSKNLVESGGVAKSIENIVGRDVNITGTITLNKGYIERNGAITYYATWYYGVVFVKAGYTITVDNTSIGNYPSLGVAESEDVSVGNTVRVLQGKSYTAPEDSWIVISAGTYLKSAILKVVDNVFVNADDTPLPGSDNVVKSGGIYPIIEDIHSKIDAPNTENFTSSVISKYLYPGIKYKIKNNNENNQLAVNFNYEDGTTGSTFYINAGITRGIATSKVVKNLSLWIADNVYNVSITTTNENQLYEKIETLKDKDIEIDDRTGVYAKYSRSVTSGSVGSWIVDENFRSGTYIVTNAIGSFTSLVFYDAENNEVYRNNNVPRGVNTEITLSSDAVKMNGYGNNLKVDIQVVAKGTILNRVDVLEAQMNTLDNKPVHDSTKRMNSGGIFKAVNVLNGYRFFEDIDVIPQKYIDYNTGDIVTRSDRYRIAKFYVEDVCNVRVAKKVGIGSDLILFKYTSSDYSTTGAEQITDLKQVDCIITLEQGYYCIGWYSSSLTTDKVPNEVVVYNYKNVGKTTNIENNNDLVAGRAAYDLYNKTLGDVITYSLEKESAITSWAFNKEISAGEYEVELLTNTSAGSSLRIYNASGTEILYIAGINGIRKIVLNEPAAKVGGYSASTGLTLKITPTFALLRRVNILEDKVGEGILFYNPQEVYEPLVSNIKYGRNAQNNGTSQFVSLLHFSDIHGKTANVARLVKFANKYNSYINDVICTGDIVGDVFTNSDILNTYPKMLQVIGNHDAWVRSYDADIVERVQVDNQIWVVKQKNCYDKFIAPNVGDWGVNQPSDAAEIGKCYYYKDYTIGTNKLRLIVLDCMHYNIGADLDDDVSIQNTWLTSVLTDARTNNIPVVIAVHYWPAWISFANGAIECSYTTKYYLSSDYIPGLLVNTVEDFITNGGEFVCYITGHSHSDVIATVPNHPNQMFIVVDCATDANSVGNSVVTGKGQDCFNIISFDTISKLVKVVRVGRDTTTENTIKRRLVYRYAQFVDGYGTHNVGLELSE